jgi:hypothetical protein
MDELKVGDVIILHLTNGATIIAKLDNEDDVGLILSRPCDLIVRNKNDGSPIQVGFSPYLTLAGSLSSIEKFVMPYSMVLFPRQAPKNIAQGYLEATSGIALASSVPAPQSPIIRQ